MTITDVTTPVAQFLNSDAGRWGLIATLFVTLFLLAKRAWKNHYSNRLRDLPMSEVSEFQLFMLERLETVAYAMNVIQPQVDSNYYGYHLGQIKAEKQYYAVLIENHFDALEEEHQVQLEAQKNKVLSCLLRA
jgi:hypothetical protein